MVPTENPNAPLWRWWRSDGGDVDEMKVMTRVTVAVRWIWWRLKMEMVAVCSGYDGGGDGVIGDDDYRGGVEVLVRWQWWRGVCCGYRRRWPETHRSGVGKVNGGDGG
ncbi:hypothetical protein Tco_0313168 [Tanacetum coccineum]